MAAWAMAGMPRRAVCKANSTRVGRKEKQQQYCKSKRRRIAREGVQTCAAGSCNKWAGAVEQTDQRNNFAKCSHPLNCEQCFHLRPPRVKKSTKRVEHKNDRVCQWGEERESI